MTVSDVLTLTLLPSHKLIGFVCVEGKSLTCVIFRRRWAANFQPGRTVTVWRETDGNKGAKTENDCVNVLS